MSDLVTSERRGAHVVLTIDHPPANAISRGVIAALRDELRQIGQHDDVRAVVITGSGPRFFAAGADITEFRTAGGESIAEGQLLTHEIEALPKPVICAVNGVALGGGCEIALACDLRIASRTAVFGQPEINLGIIPGWGGTQRLPRLIGRGAAVPLLLTGETISADRALQLGLVTEVVDPGALADVADAFAERLAAKAPLALAATKLAVNEGLDKPLSKALEVERQQFVHVFKSDDAQEGVAAFLEKRPPQFKGR